MAGRLVPVSAAGLWFPVVVSCGRCGCRVRWSCLLRPGGCGLGGARPRGEAVPQRSDVAAGEPVAGESVVVDLVELPAGVGEVPGGQARAQAPGEADQLSRAVAFQHPGGVGVVPRLDPAWQRADLATDHVSRSKTGPISTTTGSRPRSK